jgi:hypothetical protein
MPGGVAAGYHEGSRSEDLAHPVFSAFGTAVRVPHSEDFGLDFYCTLMERQDRVLVPRAYYAVQVKSTLDPWVFKTSREVRWFVEYPMSIFFCVVSKRESRIRVYHTSPRFYAWAHPPLPERLELIPAEGTEGKCTQWAGGTTFSLGAPILDFRLDQPDTDEEFRGRAAGILKYWIDVDEENLKSVRMNLRKFKMPDRYQTNILSPAGTVIVGLTTVNRDDLERSVSHLKDPLSGVTDQLFRHGDLLAAVRGMLLLRQLYWDDSHLPSALLHHANTLNALWGSTPPRYLFEAIDALGNGLDVKMLSALNDIQLLATVQRVYLTGREVTDSIIAPLKGAHELKWLHLSNTRISDDGLKYLKELVELRQLQLANTGISDVGVKFLGRLEQLTILNLARTKVTGQGMKYLKRMLRLENLYLNSTKVDDEGLRHVGKLPLLEVLTLDGTRVTDKGLVHLRRARRLHKLYRGKTKITDKGATELQKAMPGLIVIPAPSPPSAGNSKQFAFGE